MERLTKRSGKSVWIGEPLRYYNYGDIKNILERLAAIEDILGDTYDIDRLRELLQADRDGRCVVLPCNVHVGQEIWVIESERRTGLKTQVWRNFVKGFSHKRIFYQNRNCPVYSEPFDNFGKTMFLKEDEAERALKEVEKDG